MDTVKIYYPSPLGILELHSKADLLTAVLFSDSSGINNLQPTKESELKEKPQILQNVWQQLNDYFSGERKIFDLPFFQEGTPFQKSIWEQLSKIPYGRTISYTDLSKRIGNLKAIRAVGTANGRNSLAILVPCHRVIGNKGDLVGYAGELWRKKWLLDHEQKYANGVQTLF